jgi:predicted enzyme related to lactoylglutathione lyase
MQTARRLYLYAMSAIALGVFAFGIALLIEAVLANAGILEAQAYLGASTRERLSQAIAMVAVGGPVWAIHWWLAQRGRGAGRPGADAERRSPIRAAYLTLVLTVSLLVWAGSVIEVVRAVIAPYLDLPSDFGPFGGAGAVGRLLVAFAVWLFHAWIRRSDLLDGEVSGAAAWLPRLYLYAVSLGALTAALSAIGALAPLLVAHRAEPDGYIRISILEDATSVVVWGAIWFLHWRYARDVADADDWRGSEERGSRTRLAAFVATITVSSYFTVSALARLGRAFLLPALVSDAAGQSGFSSVWEMASVEVVSLVPWAIAWWLHARWLQMEPASAEPARALDVDRLGDHAVAAVGLAFGGIASGWLIGLAVDLVFHGARTTAAGGYLDGFGSGWHFELGTWLPNAIVGLAVWAAWWRNIVQRRAADPEGEANTTIRRAFLYLTLAVAIVATLGSATLLLYRVVGSVIGAQLGGDTVSEISTPLGAVIAAAIALAYHGLLLRRDLALRPAVRVEVPAGPPAREGAEGPGRAMPAGEPPTAVVHLAPAPGLRIADIVIDCADHEAVVSFWEAALGWERRNINKQYVGLEPPAARQSAEGSGALSLLFQKVPEPKVGKNRVHLDFRAADRTAEVARLVALGAHEGMTRSLGTLTWTVLSDPEGNEFCVS